MIWGFVPAGTSSFSGDGKGTKRSPGDTTQQVTDGAVYLLAPSPEPPGKSAELRLSGVAKIVKLTATLYLGQKFTLFYGSYMIRPPRWVAKTAAVSIHAKWPAGAANADDFKKRSFSALFSWEPWNGGFRFMCKIYL